MEAGPSGLGGRGAGRFAPTSRAAGLEALQLALLAQLSASVRAGQAATEARLARLEALLERQIELTAGQQQDAAPSPTSRAPPSRRLSQLQLEEDVIRAPLGISKLPSLLRDFVPPGGNTSPHNMTARSGRGPDISKSTPLMPSVDLGAPEGISPPVASTAWGPPPGETSTRGKLPAARGKAAVRDAGEGTSTAGARANPASRSIPSRRDSAQAVSELAGGAFLDALNVSTRARRYPLACSHSHRLLRGLSLSGCRGCRRGRVRCFFGRRRWGSRCGA